MSGCSVASFMANNEKILDTSSNTNLSFSPKSSEIFHFEAGTVKVPGLKRKIGVAGRVGQGIFGMDVGFTFYRSAP